MKQRNNLIIKKELKRTFESLSAAIPQTMELFYMTAFYLIVKPVIDRYDWEITWGMGLITYMNKKGEVDDDCAAIKHMEERLEDKLRNVVHITREGALLNTLCYGFPEYNCYHKSYGMAEYGNHIRKFKHEKGNK